MNSLLGAGFEIPVPGTALKFALWRISNKKLISRDYACAPLFKQAAFPRAAHWVRHAAGRTTADALKSRCFNGRLSSHSQYFGQRLGDRVAGRADRAAFRHV